MLISEIVSVLALGFGALLGLGSLLSPNWASGVVRLVPMTPSEKPGGYSEFRATYGGLLLMTHMVTALLVISFSQAGEHAIAGVLGLPMALGWMGAACGRFASLILDEAENGGPGLIRTWMATEVALALAIAAPFLQAMLLN